MARERGFTEEWLAERERKMSRWGNVGYAIGGPIAAIALGVAARELFDRKQRANAAPTGHRAEREAKPPPIYPLVGVCRAAGMPVPVPEFQFHPGRRWRFDYAWPMHQVAVEVEGGAFTQGRHTRGKGFVDDMEKYNAAGLLGWTVLRYTPEQLMNECLRDLRIAFAK